jgi:hypothetical protein
MVHVARRGLAARVSAVNLGVLGLTVQASGSTLCLQTKEIKC